MNWAVGLDKQTAELSVVELDPKMVAAKVVVKAERKAADLVQRWAL